MKLKSLMLSFAVAGLVFGSVATALAQGGGGGGFGGGFGRGPRGMFGMGGGSPWMLLRRDDVKRDLKLTDDQKTKLEDAQKAMMANFPRPQGGGGTPPTDAERAAMREKFTKAAEEMTKTIKGILTPDQADRVVQIYIQINGVTSITSSDVQAKLGLSAEQIAKVKALQEAQQKANQDIRAKVQSGELDQSAVQELRKKNDDIMKSKLDDILTADQKEKLKTAGGAPFTADPEPPRGGGGGR